MTLNGGNAPLAEVNKNSGAHHKNFNEDRPISLVAKCKPVRIIARNKKVYADMRRGFIREGRQVLSSVISLAVVIPFTCLKRLYACSFGLKYQRYR